MAITNTTPDVESVASLLNVTVSDFVNLLKREFKTIKSDPFESHRYPAVESAFFDFAVEKLWELGSDAKNLEILQKIMHREEERRFYFFPLELEAVRRILEVIERTDIFDLMLNDLDLYTLPPLLLKTRRLQFLDVSGNKLSDPFIITQLPELELFRADNNAITDLAFLSGARKLTGLGLSNNTIRHALDILKSIPTLKAVEMANCNINDSQARVLLEIPNLEKINLTGNPINAPLQILEDVEKLRAHFGIVIPQTKHVFVEPQTNDEADATQMAEPSQEPSYVSYAIRDIRLRGNPDKVLLDVEKLAPIFYDLISNSDRNGEHFFGLFGRWGRGKTYFWKYLLRNNLDTKKYIPIEFHAWKYQDTPGIWAYLYNTLNEAYMGEKPKWYQVGKLGAYFLKLLKLNDQRGKLLTVIGSLLGIVIAIFGYYYNQHARGEDTVSKVLRIGIPVSIVSLIIYMVKTFQTDARKIISSLTSNVNFNSQLGFQHEIQQELKHLIKAWIPEKHKFKKRIFLFIDDIDRCSEDKIIQIVDYIRVLLHCETIQDRITVLAAIDERILLHAIQEKYKQFIENKDNDATYKELCREYMDKLFLAGLKLGPLTEYEKRQIVEGFTAEDTATELIEPQAVKGGIDTIKATDVIIQTNDKEPVLSTPTENTIDYKLVIPDGEVKEAPVSVVSNPIASTARKEFPYEKWEQEFIKDILAVKTESTPRSIRVYTYRYLLGKQLVEKALREGKASWKQWYNTKEAKQCFALKLLHYGFKSDPEHLMMDYKSFIANYNENNAVEVTVYGNKMSLNQELGSIMYQVLTMIVAY